ncbi:hypothetical protein Pst134EA_015816 [Puccinia striiformis f. sp. tritici]|uniref:hypothetical protein n=1 Tax=Puccinia striiformis f. sp. tritici TaxID=168172 RepID=UPI0020076E07|nr:hypothetical protein Pst134EA_015816 [Puccinia striiformis f. sp. tritici]KAH9452969.1 hypothetical protein Pst134EB_016912 [Puccinia striiformis f. sp. tritici]KAH9463730.1 hypothetical protein Pst134EA_015816 [Puccinia striiformis f. sp. tritici]
MSRILAVLAGAAASTGYRFLTRNPSESPNAPRAMIDLRNGKGGIESNATGMKTVTLYPYRLMISGIGLPSTPAQYLIAAHIHAGNASAYTYTNPTANESLLKS